MGHNLEIEVTDWSAILEVGPLPREARISLSVNSQSLRVRAGTGGLQTLDADAKANIEKTIDSEVLKRSEINFRSTNIRSVEGGDDLHVDGTLSMLGTTQPISFTLHLGVDGTLLGSAVVKQTAFGMKPYSALFGSLKVKDEVTVTVEGRLPQTGPAGAQ